MGPLILSSTSTSVNLCWKPPLDLGGGTLKGYTVEAHQINISDGTTLRISCFLAPPQCKLFTINSLQPNHSYIFKVYSENEEAMSEQALVLKKPFKLRWTRDKPNQPGQPSVIYQKSDVYLQWDPSDVDGTNTTYVIERQEIPSGRWVRLNNKEVKTSLFKLKDLMTGSQYQFRVSAENQFGISPPSICSEIISVNMRTEQGVPVIIDGLEDKVLLEGQQVSFTVKSQPSGNFKWYLDKIELRSNERIQITSTEDCSTLILTNVELDDDGEILCRVRNESGLAESSAKLIVEAPPKVTLPSIYKEGLSYERGETIRLKFPICGKPQPSIHWSVDGKCVEVDENHEIKLEETFVALRIKDARKEDAGIYQVKAENQRGEDSVKLKVVMTDVPDPPSGLKIIKSDNSKYVLEWTCPEDDGGSAIEKFVVEQRQMANSWWIPVHSTTSTSYLISSTDSKVSEENEVIFRVRSVNIHGSSEPSVESQVFELKTLVRDPDLVEGKEENLATDSLKLAEALQQEEEEEDFSLSSFSESDDSEDSDQMLTCQNSAMTEKKPRLVVKSKDNSGTPRSRRASKNTSYAPANFSFLEMGNEVEFRNRYRVCEKIGRGAFTVVHRCYNKKTRQQFAARFIRIGRDMGTKEMVHRELEIMYLCQHEKLVTFYEAYDLGNYVVMVLEYIPCGELSDRIVREDPRMTEEDSRQITSQICEGIAYLHRNNIVHLDLKPENILCMSPDTNEVKLIDFGLARRLDHDAGVRMLFATPEFCAPEVVNYETVSYPTDMWSIGVLAFVMLSGTSPFLGDDDDETLSNVSDATWDFQEECWEHISIEAKDFVSRLLIRSKEHRMNIQDALRHPWLQGTKLFETSSYVQRLQSQENEVYRSAPKKEVCWTLTTRKK